MEAQISMKKMLFQARRGILEVEIFIRGFLKNHYASLSCHEKEAFSELLGQSDSDLLDWFISKKQPSRKLPLCYFIEKIQRLCQKN